MGPFREPWNVGRLSPEVWNYLGAAGVPVFDSASQTLEFDSATKVTNLSRPIARSIGLRLTGAIVIGTTSRQRVGRHRFAWKPQSPRISGSSTKVKNDVPHDLNFKLPVMSA